MSSRYSNALSHAGLLVMYDASGACGVFVVLKKWRFFFKPGPYLMLSLGVMIHLPSVEVSYGKTDSALASSSG